jgi:biopolymer transport protein ExbD
MAKRELEEINAGSMADIAFLLLIFFLVTTTMNFPKVLEERLPQKIDDVIDPPLVKKENVLEILANKNDQILIEGNRGEIEDIKDKVIEFYVHPINSTIWPQLCHRTFVKRSTTLKMTTVFIVRQWMSLLCHCTKH